MIGGHDGESCHVGHGSDLCHTHPGSSEKCGRNIEQTQKDNVPVKSAAFLASLHHNQSIIQNEELANNSGMKHL